MWQISIRISLCLGYLGLLLLTCNAYTIISLPLTARQINTNFTPPYILQYQKNISQTSPISQEIIQPGIPTVVERLYFGILGGNGYKPVYIAADNQRHRIYTLNTSLFSEGNTISVLNTKTGNFVALLKLNNKPDNSGPPPVQDLQIDSYRPQLYALWGGNGLDWSGSNLTIIDTETLTVTKTISDVAVIAAAPDRLYLANNTHLWAIETNSFKKLADQDLEPHQGRGALLINAQANRLYLWKSDPALVEVFEADSLTLIHHYSIKGKLAGAIIDEDNQRLLVVTNDKNKNFLRALDMDGYPLSKPTPVPLLGNNSANFDFRMVIDKHTLYIVEGEDKSYYLRALALPNLIPATDLSLSLTFYPYDLTFDTNTGYFYGTQYDTNLILEIDSITGDTRSIPTYSTVTDALADPTTNQLYVLNQWGTLWVLGLTDGKEVARLETGVQADWIYYGGDALSLDPNQSRLYVDGNQFGIVDTRSLTLTMSLSLPGQATFDPTRNRTYLTSKDCGTQILNTETGEELAILFPYGAKEPPQIMGPCIYYNKLDVKNQILYASGRICSGGSSCGSSTTSVFDVSTSPPRYITNLDGGAVTFDPDHNRTYLSVSNGYGDRWLNRFELRDRTITRTMSVYGAGGRGQIFYDPTQDRLYEQDGVFDGDLALLVSTDLPGSLLSFDAQHQRLYSRDDFGNLFIIATTGGQLKSPPITKPLEAEETQTQTLVSTTEGVLFRLYNRQPYRSDDGGRSWQFLGKGLPDKPFGALAVSPNYMQDQMALIGTSFRREIGGLFRSTDGGQTWWPSTRGLTTLQITQIIFSPTFSQDRTIFLNTLSGRYSDVGLFRSTDGGETWENAGNNFTSTPYYRLGYPVQSPLFADDGLVFIAVDNKLLRSTDKGNTWTDTGVIGNLVAFSPNFSKDGLIISDSHWRSTDKGQTWQPSTKSPELADLQGQEFFFSPNFGDNGIIYLLLKNRYGYEISLQRSEDAGQSWQMLQDQLPVGFESASATFVPTGKLYLSASNGQDLTLDLETLTWSSIK